MGNGDFQVDTDALWAAASSFEGLANAFVALEANYTGQMDVYNGCWGTDTTGKSIESQYLPARQTVPQAILTIGQAIRSYATSMGAAANAYEGVEFGNLGG